MLGELYYLNASLPTLIPGEPVPMSSEAFVALCRGHLGEEDFESLQACRLWQSQPTPSASTSSSPSGPPKQATQQRWIAFERGLRWRLAGLRADQLGWENSGVAVADASAAEDGTVIRETAQAAFEDSDPLAAETQLFQARWHFLDELDRLSFMTLDNLVIYHLKLQLLEGQAELSRERGQQNLADLRRIIETELPGEGFFPTAAPATTSASAI